MKSKIEAIELGYLKTYHLKQIYIKMTSIL